MNFNYKLTSKVLDFIKEADLEEIHIGCSNTQVFRIDKNNSIYYLKVSEKGLITSEYEKLKWLNGKLEVPNIILYDVEDNVECLITESIQGEMICNKYYEDNREEGLKVLKEAFDKIYSVDISDCPFNTSIDYCLNIVEYNVNNNLIKIEDIKEETIKKYGSIENILEYLKDNKFYDELCFSHGDPSLPNIFGNKDKFTGFIDIGECGIADKWFDLAICEKSIKRNYGKEYIDKFYEILNIVPDRKKIDYYLLMMELYL